MSLHRGAIVALATPLFAAGFGSTAFACCNGGGYAAFDYGWGGCGGCGVYAVAPAPVLEPAPLAVTEWGTGCGCGQAVVYATPAQELTPVAPAPIYVTDQGPDYTGPGVMVPYRIWSPAAGAAATAAYPYISGAGGGYGLLPYRVRSYSTHPYYRPYGPRLAYGERVWAHPRYYGPTPRWYPHHPLAVRY